MLVLILITFTLLLFSGVPIFLSLSALAFALFFVADVPFVAVINEMYRLTDQEIFVTLPLFTFAGVLMSRTGMPKRLLSFTRAAVGWMPGGLAIVSVLACSFITAFTGVTGVTIVAMGILLYPVLIEEGYSEKFTSGLLTSSGSLGLLLPPALPLILFAIIAKIDPVKLFTAGVLPMLLMLAGVSTLCVFESRRLKISKVRFSVKNLIRASFDFKWELPVFIIIPVGIFGGFLTAVEAASVMAFYVLIAEVFITKEINFLTLKSVARDSMILIATVLVIIMASLATSNYFIQEDVPFKLFQFLSGIIKTKTGFLIALNVFLLILGCFLDIFSSIMIVIPLILPVAEMYGINLYHLGIIFLANMQIGYSTPPLGMNLFIASRSFKKPVTELFSATLPFIAVLIAVLIIITYIPALSLVLIK